MKIRECEERDLKRVIALLHQLQEVAELVVPLEEERIEQLFAQMQAAPQFYLNLVCEVDGRVEGFLSMIFYLTLFHRGGTALINELVVERTQRGRGLGQALIEQAVKEAKQRGMDEIEVGTEQENTAAQAFYRKMGFDESYVLLGMEFAD
jgi:ribosomal protein S18 acetylase RimI-like enzyme